MSLTFMKVKVYIYINMSVKYYFHSITTINDNNDERN